MLATNGDSKRQATVVDRCRIRIPLLSLIALVGVLCPVAGSAFADTFKIAAFNDARSNRRFMGITASADPAGLEGWDHYWSIRSTLLSPDNFGPGSSVPGTRPIEFVAEEVADARPGYYDLSVIDLLIMNEVTPLSDPTAAVEEFAAIADFVRGGGCLVVITDYVPQAQAAKPGVAAANGVLAALDGNTGKAGRFVGNTTTPHHGNTQGKFVDWWGSGVLWGPFPYYDPGISMDSPGTVVSSFPGYPNEVPFACSDHNVLTTGDWSHVIGQRRLFTQGPDEATNILTEISGLSLGLEESRGNVMVAGDVLFTDYYTFPGFPLWPRNVNNATILMNFIHQQMYVIPEPGAIVLLAIGVATLLCFAPRRRRPRATVTSARQPV